MHKFHALLLEPAQLSLALVAAGATFLAFRCFSNPNRVVEAAKHEHDKDRFAQLHLIKYLDIYRYLIALGGISNCAFTVFHPLHPSLICPTPANLNKSLFVWDAHTAFSMVLIYLGGFMRIATYHQLGNRFTYGLTIPATLETGGFYRYMQHPAYTAAAICTCGILSLLVRFDGGLGCYVPYGWTFILTTINSITFSLVVVLACTIRVVDEEKMLSETFGQKWLRYHRKTRRFLPGVI